MQKVELVVLKHILTNRVNALGFINLVEKPIELFSTDLYILTKNVIPYIQSYRQAPTLRVLTERSPKSSDEIKSKYDLVMSQEINETEFLHDLDMLKKAYQSKLILEFKSKLNATEEYNLDINKQILELNKLIKFLNSVDQDVLYTSENVDVHIETYISELKTKKENENLKVRTGLTTFDNCTNGGLSRDADFLVILGETNSGKSMYLNTLGINMWLNGNTIDTPMDKIKPGNNVVLMSLEMPYKDYFDRFLGALADVDYFHIESGKLSKDEKNRIQKARVFMKNYPFKYRIIDYYGKRLSSRAMDLILDDVYKEFTPDILVSDYISLMDTNDGSGGEQDWLAISTITREFRDVLRSRHLVGVSAWQALPPPDGKYGGEGKVGVHRVSRSRDAASHVTHLVQIISRDPEKENNYPDAEYAIIKARKGIKGRKGKILKDFGKGRVLNDPYFDAEFTGTAESSEFDDLNEMLELTEIFG
jgi:hypothetical protein